MMVGSVGTPDAWNWRWRRTPKFFLASTSECYGDPKFHRSTKTTGDTSIPSGRAASTTKAKRFSEAMTMAYHRYHEVDTHIVRIFNTYGPRMRLNDGRALPNFRLSGAQRQAAYDLWRRETDTQLCYVADLIEGIHRLMMSNEHLPTNVGNPQEITILEFAERIRKHFENPPPIVFGHCQRTIRTPLPGHYQSEAHPEMGAQGGAGRRAEAHAGALQGSLQ